MGFGRSQALVATVIGVLTLGLANSRWLAADEVATEAAPTPLAQRLTPAKLDEMLGISAGGDVPASAARDEQFLRRATFDLVGRPPTLEEQQQFSIGPADKKYGEFVERLLASPEFGVNWSNYWCDTIAFRVPPPELTYLNYQPLKKWLAEKLNGGAAWSEIARELLTAGGKIKDNPAATFVGYHQANATNLAGEASRIFLGQQIGCAQCHDHPFDHWKRAEFHALAAFFARTKSKLSQNDGIGTVVSALDKGEYAMPDMHDPSKQGTEMRPTFLDGGAADGRSDEERRRQLADWITSTTNPWFAKAYVNRVWSRLMGRGFFEPIDDLGDSQRPVLPEVHAALAQHFTATSYDIKDLFRLVMNSSAYRRGARLDGEMLTEAAPTKSPPLRFRGDEVFAALTVGLELPNVTPKAKKPTAEIRFPPPPKSTRDLVHEAFGTDPSLAAIDAPRTMAQALLMMNSKQLHKQVNGGAESGTMLARLLAEESDDANVSRQLFRRVLARAATDEEVGIALDHVKQLGDRRAAFEDLLWSLINSAEFTTRK